MKQFFMAKHIYHYILNCGWVVTMRKSMRQTEENPNDLPQIMCKLDALCLQDLFGSKYGVWAVAMQAKFFGYGCASQHRMAASWFEQCFCELDAVAARLAIVMLQMNETPLLASASNVYWSGSNIASLKVDADMLQCFVLQLERLKIEALLVEQQVAIVPIQALCANLSNWCQSKKCEGLALAGEATANRAT